MNTSPSIANLAKALSLAQGEMTFAAKQSENPFFSRGNYVAKYADLASVWAACRGPLSNHGLAVTQHVRTDEHFIVSVETILMHESGEWIASTLRVPVMPMVVEKGQPKEITPQAIVSASTYARRVSLAAIIGLAQADDDGNAASGKHEREVARMDESAEANHRAAIESADTVEVLAKAYHAAIAAAADDQDAQRGFISLTNARKKAMGATK